MEIKDKTIALLIDCENISHKYLTTIFEELNQFGNTTYKRIYGDFKNQALKEWDTLATKNGMIEVQQSANTKGKNSSDSALIIDAMDILYKGRVDCICLATSDSDFTRLAVRFREEAITVIGAGEEKTPESFRNACDRFIVLDKLLQDAPTVSTIVGSKKTVVEQTENKTDSEIEKLLATCIEIITGGAESDGWMHFSEFINQLFKKDNSFNPKNYGYQARPVNFFKQVEINGEKPFELRRKSNFDEIALKKDK
ncbi:MAG: NYN domain-containing protein [Clostridiales bacterium]|nr:NYN domain-containing protein [Clostridiales bacterium]